MRAFVGAFLSEGSAGQLEALARDCLEPQLGDAHGARWVPARNYHVTLKFLGEVEPDVLGAAAEAVAALAGRARSVRATGFVGLPRSARARLAALVLDRDAQLGRWWAELERRLGEEARGFRPHVTVLRLRRPHALRPLPLAEPLTLELDPPRLYRSELGSDGSRYSPLV